MRKIIVLSVLCALAVGLSAVSVMATGSFARQTGKTCGYCHIDPDGGGPLTPEGQYFADNGVLPPEIPAVPTGLTATAVSDTQIDLAWTDASSDETGFKVEVAASASGTFSMVADLPAGTTTYSHTGLTASTTYYYRVNAYNDAGDSAYTDVASATTQAPPLAPPAAPTGLAAAASSSSQIDLSWTDASDNETGFKVERGDSASGPFTEVASLAAGSTSHNDTGLTESTTYYYRVYALNADGNSGYSNVASATTQAGTPTPTPPAAPTGLAASAVSTSQIDLSWTDASDNETGFKVERGSSASGPFTEVASLAAGSTSHNDTGLTESTTYYYRVYALNADGNSGYSNVASATTQAGTPTPTPPAAPTGLAASAASSSQIDLSWTDASDNETGFRVERGSSAGGPFTEVASLAAGSTSYSDTGLAESTTYYYRVYAVNADGNSDFSNTASATTQAVTPPPPTGDAPAAPTGLTAQAASRRQVNLTWTDNSNNETGFRIWRSNKASGHYKIVATVGADTTGYTDTVRGKKTYYYRVMAFNSDGSSVSNTASVKMGKSRGGGDDDDDDDDDHDDDDRDDHDEDDD